MRQCYVCGDIITEPVSAYARNLCLRCATAPPEPPPQTIPPAQKKSDPLPPLRSKPARRPPPANHQSLRGAICVVVGGVLIGHSIFVIWFGGVLHSLVCGGGLALLIVGCLDLYYWWTESSTS